MRVLFLDCFSGISGDMTVGALCDLGVKPSALEWELGKLEIGDFHMHFERDQRQQITGVKFGIHEGATHREEAHSHEPHHHHEHGHSHDHGHSHGHQLAQGHAHGRTHAEIRKLIEESELSDFVKMRALSIFQRIAVAEGKIHGVPADDVAFHEVGALDSIADIVCVCAGIESLRVEKVFASRLTDGSGWIDCAHGRFPLPAPATLEILQGIPIAQVDEPYEFITPTGAAILAEFCDGFGPMPAIAVEKIGYGIGSRVIPSRPNVLRAVLGEMSAAVHGEFEKDVITRMETNLDDLSPEIAGAVMERLFAAGALDVFLTPIQMKKNRPAFQLTVLCEESAVDRLAGIVFAETTSFGLRMDRVERLKLERKFEEVETAFGKVTVKLGLKGGKVVQVAPEFESCKAASEKAGVALREVYRAAEAARHASARA